MVQLDEKRRRMFEAFVRATFSVPEQDLLSRLDEVAVPEPYRLRMKVVYSAVSPAQLFDRSTRLGRVVDLPPASGIAFTTDMKFGKERSRWLRIPFLTLPTTEENIYVAVAVCLRQEWIDLNRFFQQLYPALVPILLSQRELIQSIRALKQRLTHLDLRVRELSATETIETAIGSRRRSVREWTDEALDELLSDVDERRQRINSLKLDFYRELGSVSDVTPVMQCKVTRRSEVEVSGKFEIAWQTVVADIVREGAVQMRLFSHRGLVEREFDAAPLTIRFKRPVFDEIEEVRRLVAMLMVYPNSMHAVQHGNPYAYLQIADSFDGSAFDIWAVTSDSILIVPRLRATVGAVERLVHYIFDSFREGDVGDAAQ